MPMLEIKKKNSVLFLKNLDKIDKPTFSVEHTVYNFSQLTLFIVQYDLKNEKIII